MNPLSAISEAQQHTTSQRLALRAWLTLSALLLCLVPCSAQIYRVRPAITARPRPLLVLTGTLGIAADTSMVTFALVPAGTATGSATIGVTTTWANVTGALITLNIYGYFALTTALTNTANISYTIPSSEIYGLVGGLYTNVPAYTAFTQATPFSGASGLDLVTQGNLLTLGANGSIVNTLSLRVNLAGQPNLPAGTYTGVLNLVAQAL